jgi:hypothetical protein
MVFAKIGRAAGVGAIFRNADAVDVEAADDRPARGARRKGRTGDAGFGKQEIAKLGRALSANFLVRHHRDGRKLICDDRQHALLRRGSLRRGRGRRRCGFRRALAVAAGRGAGNAHRLPRGNDGPAPRDRTWRRHGDLRQLRRSRRRGGVLGQPAVGHRAQQ